MAESRLSVVVCTYNRSSLLRSALQSLVDQSLERDRFEVLVIDNNSTDDTYAVAAEFVQRQENFRYIFEPAQGLSHARNRGWQEARGEFVAYIDDDAKACPDWCEKILRCFDEVQPQPIAVGGQILPWYEGLPPSWFLDEFEIKTYGDRSGPLRGIKARSGFCGSNMTILKEALFNYSGFNCNYGMSGEKVGLAEETELFRRISDREPERFFFYDADLKVYHWVPKEKMTIKYQFKRSFVKGKTKVKIESIDLFSTAAMRQFWGFPVFLLIKFPWRVVFAKENRYSQFARCVRDLGVRFGIVVQLLCGSIRQH